MCESGGDRRWENCTGKMQLMERGRKKVVGERGQTGPGLYTFGLSQAEHAATLRFSSSGRKRTNVAELTAKEIQTNWVKAANLPNAFTRSEARASRPGHQARGRDQREKAERSATQPFRGRRHAKARGRGELLPGGGEKLVPRRGLRVGARKYLTSGAQGANVAGRIMQADLICQCRSSSGPCEQPWRLNLGSAV